jgi:uncharacterized peroxidase-related enzyme
MSQGISQAALVAEPAHVPVLLPEQAAKGVNAVYEEFYRRMSFPSPPNFIMTQGHSSTVVRGTWEVVKNVLVTGDLPRWQKEMMFVAISKDRNCHYFTAAHIACCRMLGVKTDLIDCLVRNVDDLSNPKLRAMIKFSLKCSRNPQTVTKDDHDSLRQEGLTQSEIIEVIAMSAFAVYANIIADATAMEPDQMFDTV